ncbi:hypothetical protein, partial [Nonomuraea fuscirosea]|uniref:hypothetical protein n=1 Tax=Nonomuraea fuscirosea TaxID=1291556 RepID=UPI0033EC5BCA
AGAAGFEPDLSRTVGWFTTLFPVTVARDPDPLRAIGSARPRSAPRDWVRATPIRSARTQPGELV